MEISPRHDPELLDWSKTDLPDSWADDIAFNTVKDWRLFIRKVRGKQIEKVTLPDGLPLNAPLPKYLLQEFHNLPNGNFSNQISQGYITGFDISMLGKMAAVRKKIAADLKGCQSVLDIGCAGGRSTAVLTDSGISDVWGLDPSPYLLKHASRDFPHIRFVQGLAENTGFTDARFDGISVCFVFHEIPPRFSNLALQEAYRILKPGGLISIAEPAPEQLDSGYWKMLFKHGPLGVYFKYLANKVHEPFINAWHKTDHQQWAESNGFKILQDTHKMPVRYLLLKKV